MLSASLMWAVLWSAPAQEAGPEALVARLGSADFGERVAAAEALDRLGPEAIPPLIAARDSGDDPRVARRADALLDRIAVDRLRRPTMVRLDFRGRPLDEVLATLNDRHDLRLELWLVPPPPRGFGGMPGKADPAWERQVRRQPITLEAPDPVPFWEAIDRLGRAAGIRPEVMPWERLGPRLGPYRLFPGHGGVEVASDDGPYRTIVTAVGPADANTLAVDLAILPEPGLTLVRLGPAELTEAVDDRGRSLLLPGGEAPRGLPPVDRAASLGGPVGITARVHLKRLEDPGRSIARLRGHIPAIAIAPRPDPLRIPLDGAAGRVFRTDEVALVVDEVGEAPDGRGIVSAVVTASMLRLHEHPLFPPRMPARVPDLASYRGDLLSHLDLYDAEGRELAWNHQHESGPDYRIKRLRLTSAWSVIEEEIGFGRFPGHRPGDRPVAAEVRFHRFVQGRIDISFDLSGLPPSFQRPNQPPAPPAPRPPPKEPDRLATLPVEVPR